MPTPELQFSRRLRAAGLSQSELSRTTGIDRSLLSQYASGQRVPSGPTAEKLAAVLDTTAQAVVLDCLRDRWARAAFPAPDDFISGNRPPVLRVLNSLRELSGTRGASPAFRDRIERAGDRVLEAVAEELGSERKRAPRRPLRDRR